MLLRSLKSRNLVMDLARWKRANNRMNMKVINGKGIQVNCDAFVIIKVSNSLVLRVMSRSLLLAIFMLTLPIIGSHFGSSYSSDNVYDSVTASDITGFESFPAIFQDLVDEGLIKKGHKSLVLSSGIGQDSQFIYDNDIDLVIESDLNRQSSIPDGFFDVVFSSRFEGSSKFIDRILKVGGIVVVQLRNEFRQFSNYKIVYLRRFNATIVATRKTGLVDCSHNSPTKHPNAKKDALNGLEDVWLEPPRRALAKSGKPVKKIQVSSRLVGGLT